MKTIPHLFLAACLATGMPILAANPPPGAPATTTQTNTDQSPPAPTATPDATTNAAATPMAQVPGSDLATNSVAGTNALTGTNTVAAAIPAAPLMVMENGTNGLC